MSKKYAYWRVSTKEQNEARQLVAFKKCNEEIDRVFSDKESGKDMERDGYKEMIEILEPGDLVIIKSLDRLSRKYDDIAEEWRYITKEKGADILVLDMADLLDTRKGKDLIGTLISDIVVKLLSYVAETERENIKARQEEGIAAMPVINGKKVSKKTGRTYGRQEKRPDNFLDVYRKQQRGELSLKEAMDLAGVGRTRWYELRREIDSAPPCLPVY